jgi:hypothetical protein
LPGVLVASPPRHDGTVVVHVRHRRAWQYVVQPTRTYHGTRAVLCCESHTILPLVWPFVSAHVNLRRDCTAIISLATPETRTGYEGLSRRVFARPACRKIISHTEVGCNLKLGTLLRPQCWRFVCVCVCASACVCALQTCYCNSAYHALTVVCPRPRADGSVSCLRCWVCMAGCCTCPNRRRTPSETNSRWTPTRRAGSLSRSSSATSGASASR